MDWTYTPDDKARCAGELGVVKDDETVARLLMIQNPPQGWQAFKRDDFLPPKAGGLSNECGDSHGCSVDRANGLTSADLDARSEAFAAAAQAAAEARKPQKIMRIGGGHKVGHVGRLRAIRRYKAEDEQVVFVYDDPKLSNPEHAIIRMSVDVPEEEIGGIVDQIAAQFR